MVSVVDDDRPTCMEDCLYFGLCCCVIDALCGSCCVGGEGKEVAYAAPAAKASKPKKAKTPKKKVAAAKK